VAFNENRSFVIVASILREGRRWGGGGHFIPLLPEFKNSKKAKAQ